MRLYKSSSLTLDLPQQYLRKGDNIFTVPKHTVPILLIPCQNNLNSRRFSDGVVCCPVFCQALKNFTFSPFLFNLSLTDRNLLKLSLVLQTADTTCFQHQGWEQSTMHPISILVTLCKRLPHTPPTLQSSICLASQHPPRVKTWRQLQVSSGSVFRRSVRVSFHNLIRFCSPCSRSAFVT